MTGSEDVARRLAVNSYNVSEISHIEVYQEIAKETGSGKLLVKVCPARVYSENEDGTIGVLFAACMECGTCKAVASPGSLMWHYPNGGFGINFREG
jgi:ferredoxin like protein